MVGILGRLVCLFSLMQKKTENSPYNRTIEKYLIDFVKSIGNLYLQEGDFHDMMSKKAQYFLNKVRMDLLIDTQNLDEDFAKKLQLKQENQWK
jgi:hypothetical protein